MKVKLVTKWRENRKGVTVDVSENRAGLLIRSGIAIALPRVETADAAPKIDDDAKAKAKAGADAAKAAKEAEKKAKAEAKANKNK